MQPNQGLEEVTKERTLSGQVRAKCASERHPGHTMEQSEAKTPTKGQAANNTKKLANPKTGS